MDVISFIEKITGLLEHVQPQTAHRLGEVRSDARVKPDGRRPLWDGPPVLAYFPRAGYQVSPPAGSTNGRQWDHRWSGKTARVNPVSHPRDASKACCFPTVRTASVRTGVRSDASDGSTVRPLDQMRSRDSSSPSPFVGEHHSLTSANGIK